MGTRYLFEKAVKISQNLLPCDKIIVRKMCNTIQKSQENLIRAAEVAMFNCQMQCKGICCKSLDIDSVFSLWDFIFILTLKPGMKEEIQNRLDAHTSIYLSNCPFLENGQGPCIFPDGIKAQICAITFCSNDEKIKKPARAVTWKFYKLCWMIQYLRVKRIARKMRGLDFHS